MLATRTAAHRFGEARTQRAVNITIAANAG
jgi:hypothetical protein